MVLSVERLGGIRVRNNSEGTTLGNGVDKFGVGHGSFLWGPNRSSRALYTKLSAMGVELTLFHHPSDMALYSLIRQQCIEAGEALGQGHFIIELVYGIVTIAA